MAQSSADTLSKPQPRRDHASDRQVLAHVEKWLVVIREISGERPAKLPG